MIEEKIIISFMGFLLTIFGVIGLFVYDNSNTFFAVILSLVFLLLAWSSEIRKQVFGDPYEKTWAKLSEKQRICKSCICEIPFDAKLYPYCSHEYD